MQDYKHGVNRDVFSILIPQNLNTRKSDGIQPAQWSNTNSNNGRMGDLYSPLDSYNQSPIREIYSDDDNTLNNNKNRVSSVSRNNSSSWNSVKDFIDFSTEKSFYRSETGAGIDIVDDYLKNTTQISNLFEFSDKNKSVYTEEMNEYDVSNQVSDRSQRINVSYSQWIVSCISMIFVNPLILSAYLYMVMSSIIFYYESSLGTKNMADNYFATQSYHDRVVTGIIFVGVNLTMYAIVNVLINITEIYASSIKLNKSSFGPINTDTVMIVGNTLLNMPIGEMFYGIYYWFRKYLTPIRIISTMAWISTASCKKVVQVVFMISSFLYVLLLMRMLFDIPYTVLPSEDSLFLGSITKYTTDFINTNTNVWQNFWRHNY